MKESHFVRRRFPHFLASLRSNLTNIEINPAMDKGTLFCCLESIKEKSAGFALKDIIITVPPQAQPWKCDNAARSRDHADSRTSIIGKKAPRRDEEGNERSKPASPSTCGNARYFFLPWRNTPSFKGVVVSAANSAIRLLRFSGRGQHCDTMPATARTRAAIILRINLHLRPVTKSISSKTLLRRN